MIMLHFPFAGSMAACRPSDPIRQPGGELTKAASSPRPWPYIEGGAVIFEMQQPEGRGVFSSSIYKCLLRRKQDEKNPSPCCSASSARRDGRQGHRLAVEVKVSGEMALMLPLLFCSHGSPFAFRQMRTESLLAPSSSAKAQQILRQPAVFMHCCS